MSLNDAPGARKIFADCKLEKAYSIGKKRKQIKGQNRAFNSQLNGVFKKNKFLSLSAKNSEFM
ncbi:MAG: hypothetical protein CSA20_08550 [Deltaproteobacteria bacterium]|nr:MAG: hypothetical protein CSA20_08550 [Deltaproteobacteria bacterium]